MRRLVGPRMTLDRLIGERSVRALHHARGRIEIDRANDAQNRRARAIEVSIEANEIVARELAQPVLAANAPPANAMRVVEQLEQRLGRNGRGIVGFALRLLDDDLELLRELLRIDHRIRVRIALDVEAALEARRRQHGVVARVIVDRAGVEITAGRFRLLRDRADRAGNRSLEEHVLEHVRDADDVVRLIEVAGLHERHDRHDGRRVIAAKKNRQPVRENEAPDARGIQQGAGRTRGAPNWRRRAKISGAQ